MKRIIFLVVVLCLALIFLRFTGETGIQQSTAAQKYHIRDLGTLGGTASEAYGLNDSGQVVGSSKNSSGSTRACLWENGTIEDFNVAEYFSCAYGINNNGQAVGYGADSGWNYQNVFIWENGVLAFLGNLGYVWDINDNVQVVGEFGLWENGIITGLGSLGGDDPEGRSINGKGQIVGRADVNSNPSVYIPHAFIWENGTIEDLGTFTGGSSSSALCINDNGQVVGGSELIQYSHAALWENDQIIDLGTLGGNSSGAHGINNKGIVVGISDRATGPPHAFVWDPVNNMQDLNDLIISESVWELETATAINNAGQIAGYGQVDLDGDGNFDEKHAYLLTPVSPVTIDIQPGDDLNLINPESTRFVWVVVLTTDDFDARTVDGMSVTFGRTGTEASPKFYCRRDIDRDRDKDLLLKFRIRDTGIECGDTTAILKGMTLSGQSFQVSDSINTGICEVIQRLEESKLSLSNLPLNVFKNKNNKRVLRQRLDQALRYICADRCRLALDTIKKRILIRMDGCALRGKPDTSPPSKKDWIKTCDAQAQVYPSIKEAADLLEDLILKK